MTFVSSSDSTRSESPDHRLSGPNGAVWRETEEGTLYRELEFLGYGHDVSWHSADT